MLSVLLIALLFNILAVRNGITPVYVAQAQLLPNMYIHPAEIRNSSAVVGQTFLISINISNVEHLFGWQANITFNKAVVNCTSTLNIVRSSWFDNKFGGAKYTQFSRSINYADGYILVACSQKIPYSGMGASGNGTLAYITFTVIADERATLLAFGENTYLRTVISDTSVPIEPFTTRDGSFDNRQPQVNVTPAVDFEYTPLGIGPEGEKIEFDPSSSYDPDAWLERYYWDYGDSTTELYLYNRTAYGSEGRLDHGNWTITVIHSYEHAGIYRVALTVTDNDGATATTTKDVMVPGHDIAVTDVKAPYVAVMPGILMPVNVNVSNNGNYTETFAVDAYVNDTLVETKNIIDMPAHSETTLTFTWNTTGVAFGRYILKANATEVAEETYTQNNLYIDGAVTVASSNLVQFQTTVGHRIFLVQVDSTSIAADFAFNRAEKKINFSLTGALGWFSNVTVPTALLNASSPDSWIAKFDGSSTSYTATSNGTHYFIYFEYVQSAEPHIIEIIGETVATPPIALFTASKTTALAGESITFDASTSYDPDGTTESWDWNFGDGVIGSGEVVQHSFTTNGTYIVAMTVKDDEQLANSTQKTITVIDYPAASFSYSPEEPLVDHTVTFDATASNPVGGTITEYAWKFGDGQIGTGATITHSYSTTGTFTVNLTVTDSEGLANSTTKAIIVKIHDIAITSLTATPSAVKIGETVTIQITVANKGNFTESFTVTAYVNGTEIETKSITGLTAGNSQPLTYSWNTASATPNTYTFSANTSTIAEETRRNDNIRVGGTVNVQKKISALTIDATSMTLTVGTATTITGTLSPTLQGVTVTLQYRLVGEAWSTLNTMTTDSQGKYQLTWTPTKAGNYEARANWQGDSTTEGSQSVTIAVTVNEAAGWGSLQYAAVAVVIIVLIAAVVFILLIRRR